MLLADNEDEIPTNNSEKIQKNLKNNDINNQPLFLKNRQESYFNSIDSKNFNLGDIEKIYLELNKEKRKVLIQEKKIIKFDKLLQKKENQLSDEKVNIEKFKDSIKGGF